MLRRIAARRAAVWLPLALLLLLAAAARIGALVAFPGVFAFDQTGAVHGSEAYDTYARNLLSTGVYGREPGIPDAAIPPGYAYALAAVYAVFGRGWLTVGVFHTLLDLFSIACLVQIGRRLLPDGNAVGLVAGALYALYPYLIFQNLTLIDTPLFMALLYAFLLCGALLRERFRWSVAILAGLALVAGALTRPAILLVAPLLAVWFLFRLDLGQTVRRLLPVAVVSAALVAPWLAHVWGVYGAFVPIATNGGMNFWFGNSPYTIPFLRAGFHTQWASPDEPIDTRDTRRANDDLYRISFAYLRAHPEQIPELLWVKFLAYWSIDVFPSRNPIPGATPVIDYSGAVRLKMQDGGEIDLSGLPANDPVAAYSAPLFDQFGRIVHRLYFGPLLVLALVGLAGTARRWRDVSLLWFVQAAMTAFYVIYVPATRYRAPTDPLLFLFSAWALVALARAAWRVMRPAPAQS